MDSRLTLISHSIINLLNQHHKTLGVAESCTGGLICEWLTRVPGSSAVFKGGVVAYTDDVKAKVLGIDTKLIESSGAVSEAVAQTMATQITEILTVDYAISTTGFAGPTGGTEDTPVGTVFVGLVTPFLTETVKYCFPSESRQKVREMAAIEALVLLKKMINKENFAVCDTSL
jgi:PncC family amidohydrolase